MEICKDYLNCGGCKYLEFSYVEQLQMKVREVKELLAEKEIDLTGFLGIQGSDNQFRYRNKMEYTFGDEVKDGPPTLGMHKRKQFMSIVTVDECMLVDEDFNKILSATLQFFTDKEYPFYHKKSHKGFQRNLIVRKGERTKELLINIVTTSQYDFSKDKEVYKELILNLSLENTVVGILHTICDGIADAVNPDSVETLYGRDYYMERVLDLDFKVSAFSFFQTNVLSAEKLYATAIDYIEDVDGKIVYDLYSGTGTITQAVATRAKKAIGVELVEEAVAAAIENAKANNLDNCTFYCGDVFEVLDNIDEKPEVIIVDPPRVGIHTKALQKILNYGVNQIIYVSCNPKSLAENLVFLSEGGYNVEKIQVFDNFPNTKHIECVCLMSRVEK